MSENIEAWTREQRFGHVVLQTYLGEVYSLDLRETPSAMNAAGELIEPGGDIESLGCYLPPPDEVVRQRGSRWEGIGLEAVSRAVPVEVRLVANAEAFETINRIVLSRERLNGERSPDSSQQAVSESFQITGPREEDFHEGYVTASAPIRRPGRTLWVGTFGAKGSRAGGEFHFVLEQYGTQELMDLLLYFFLLTSAGTMLAEPWLCQVRAVIQCGRGNIKYVKTNNSISGTELVISGNCEIECFVPQHRR